MKDVASCNESFQAIILDILDSTMTELIDRYSRGLKGYLWETQCLKHYETLDAIMLGALKVEAAKRGVRRVPNTDNAVTAHNGPAPMAIANYQIFKQTPEER